jgi:predicted flavoprotein YhiN
LCNTTASSVRKENNNFIIELDDGKILETEKLVFAFGPSGNIDLFKNFGLELNLFKKSLVSLKTSKNKGLDGVRVSNVKVTLKIGKEEHSEIGEVLF